MRTLPAADVVSCYFDDGVAPRLAAMRLRWPDDAGTNARLWRLPENVRLISTLPESFGVRIHRTASDAYEVCLLWNRITLHWAGIPRSQLLNSSLGTVLTSIGTDLDNLLNQPILSDAERLHRVA